MQCVVIFGHPGLCHSEVVNHIAGRVNAYVFDIEDKLKSEGNKIMHFLEKHSRNDVVKKWKEVVTNELNGLKNSNNNTLLVASHAVYYEPFSRQLYSPISIDPFIHNDIKPNKVVVLIDDMYDAYERLTEKGEIFSKPQNYVFSKPQNYDNYSDDFMQDIYTLFQWREEEILVAENFALQFGAKFFVFGIKNPLQSLVNFIMSNEPIVIYISHPISNIRDSLDKEEQCSFCNEINSLSSHLLKTTSHVVIQPTSIDEFRIKDDLSLRKRWTLPEDTILKEEVCNNGENSDEKYQQGNFFSKYFAEFNEDQKKMVKTLLDALISRQIDNRDLLYVSYSDVLLVYRPFYSQAGQELKLSKGVSSELKHSLKYTNKLIIFVFHPDDIKKIVSNHIVDWVESKEMAVTGEDFKRRILSLIETEEGSRQFLQTHLSEILEFAFGKILLEAGIHRLKYMLYIYSEFDKIREDLLSFITNQRDLEEFYYDDIDIGALINSEDLKNFLNHHLSSPGEEQ